MKGTGIKIWHGLAIRIGCFHQPSPCTIRESRYRRGMFELTRREKGLIAGFVFIFLLGFGIRQWRDSAAFDSCPAQVH